MEDEDAELEEGEAKEALDPDTDFSYLDTRLEMLLGDCQKEFQGGNLSTEKLGSKYGGYGTFLPTQARIPSVLADPHPAPPASEVGRPVGEGVAAELVKRSVGASVQQVSLKENGAVSAFGSNKQVKLKIKLGKQGAENDEAKRKALYNGLGLGLDDESDDDASLDDDDDNYSRSNVESPEPSPMSMIEMMTAPCPEGGLLSPLSDSTFEIMDAKESNSYMHKSGNFFTATSNAYPSGSKVDLSSPRASGLEHRKGKGFDIDKHTTDRKKGADFAADSNGGRKSRRDSDADKAFVKERQLKSARNDVVRGEQYESLDEKGVEGFGKEEFDLVRDPLSKSSRKLLENNKPPAANGQKEKEIADGKGPGKSQASKIRDSKEFSRSKAAGKAQNLKDNEVVRMTDGEKESYDKGLSLPEPRKQGKEDSKSTAPLRTKENSKEGFRENQKKDIAGDLKAKELVRDVPKSGSNPNATKKTSSGVQGRKGVSHEHKSSKSAHDKKSSMKELEKDRMSLPETVASKEEEKIPAVLEAVPASLVVPQLVLDNWVACDKCEQWRLLMPHVNPDTLPKKWRCKMMDWLPGMNDCKFKEEETTAAVYNLLGYQNPALPASTLPAAAVATAAVPVALQAPAPAAEPALDKWPDEVDTKKNFLPKKGVARKLGGSVAKVAAGKGVDGSVKSKNINDMGLDNSGDGTTVSDKHKPKAKEKVKRTRPNEGEDTRIRKKALQEQERNIEASQWSKEAMDVEPIQGEKERGLPPPHETQGGGPGKRKKVGTFEDLDETPNLKKNKGGRARLQFDDPQVPSEEEYLETEKRVNVQKSKREMSVLRPKDVSHSGLQDKETQDINFVLKDLRENDGVPEKRREDRDQGRRSKASEKQWRSKEDASDSEQRNRKKRRDDASYDRPNQVSPREKPSYGREDFNRSTSSKVSNSSSGSLKGVGSPLESTVSSSPVRATNGNRELFTNRVAQGHAALGTDMAMQSSPGPKHVRAASRGSSLDEGEYRHPGVTHNTTRFGKQDSSGEARDDGWYDEEDRGVDRGHSHNHHPERHPHSSGDIDDVDGQQVRRKGNREIDRRRLDIRDNDHLDHSDHIAKDRNTRDDRCRPPRESGLEKPGERSWDEDSKLDGTKYAHKRDDTSAQAHGARVGPPSKETIRENDRIVLNTRKDGSGIAVEPLDVNKRPGASSNTRGGGDRGEALKREDVETGLAKSFVGEVAAGSPAKKDKEQYAHAIQKRATNLKHSADRFKNTDETESTNLYLRSALGFLQSASVFESVQRESTTNKSMELYRDTARLCEYCGSQYNKRGDLRATALAYTCAAVARTRLMLSKKTSFANDCKEFQSAANLTSGPHMPSNGESPSSSSASDVDNLNKHHGIVPGNKASLGKAAIVSPQVPSGASSLNIPARLRPVATRFLRDALDMNALLESWQKAADATAKAETSEVTEGMAAVKQVGELGGFGDIDGVVRLVNVALDAIGH
ncbi:hypothetical protein KC19_10G187700 [Ceratodon purpureus]|uniref:CW-type domain-containing protein n=1 Tax=Ceratodon purpureus TaxID=3225 RepID=A0A8T0GLV5_CERPU|nr:hypothetical protein KC19_10G187700 [Ceratodon purpureus]